MTSPKDLVYMELRFCCDGKNENRFAWRFTTHPDTAREMIKLVSAINQHPESYAEGPSKIPSRSFRMEIVDESAPWTLKNAVEWILESSHLDLNTLPETRVLIEQLEKKQPHLSEENQTLVWLSFEYGYLESVWIRVSIDKDIEEAWLNCLSQSLSHEITPTLLNSFTITPVMLEEEKSMETVLKAVKQRLKGSATQGEWLKPLDAFVKAQSQVKAFDHALSKSEHSRTHTRRM